MNLNREVLCGFEVSERRKKVWACELEIVKLFDGICRKYGLRYYLMYGTLIGAVRHKNFIPWDDDLDVVMPREDYVKLMHIIKKELPEYYDINFMVSLTKIEDLRTTVLFRDDWERSTRRSANPVSGYSSTYFRWITSPKASASNSV